MTTDRERILADNLAAVREDIAAAARAAGRDPADVRLVAVSKHHPAEDVAALHRAGQRVFGENYVQEACAKQDALADLDLEWHFIGGLQSNKAKFVAGRFAVVHSVDSIKLARVLHKKAGELNTVQRAMLQVNLCCEDQKCGILEEDVDALLEEALALDHLRIVGLMTMPWFCDQPERVRPVFSRLRELRDGLERRFGVRLPELSMGMTGDFVQAVLEGATLVRIGTRIFGPRL
ncbi:YggS family pyridoxal phosphate-dependent enzyme [Paucidesulfovibrio longus]|uniref:YggS family pyridoxal phosphate-dependent enzyme n=1 Tax=Paucidesulfovibrio longus TaxID=889 RepID=UPI0003B6DC25|nr:YggS family pyridoxal phosphate-dependent enzyme [Paucidesulfovibrio longus]